MLVYPQKIFDAVTLTAAYTGNVSSGIQFRDAGNITILLDYTTGAGETSNAAVLQLEYSPDNITWWPLTTAYTLDGAAAATNYKSNPVILPINTMYIRFSLKETGVVTNAGTCTAWIMASGKEA